MHSDPENDQTPLATLIDDPFFVLDHGMSFRLVNPAYARLLNREAKELVGKLYSEIHPAAHGTLVYSQIQRFLKRQERAVIEDFSAELGRWLEYRLSPRAGEIAVLVHDITERKRSELALRASEAGFRAVFESAGVGMAEIGLEGRIIDVNTAAVAITGSPTKQAVMEMGLETLFEPQGAKTVLDQLAGLMSSKSGSFTTECEITCFDHRPTWLHMTVTLVTRLRQPLFFVAYFFDIAEKKGSEVSLQLALQAARLAEWDYDASSDETSCSSSFFEIFRAKPSRCAWRFKDFVERVHPAHRETFVAKFKDALAGSGDFQIELRLSTSDVHWVSLQGRVYSRDEKGRVTRIAGLVRDITLEKLAESELQNAKLAAEDANREKSYFLANMSHEIRTPLSAVLGFTQTLLSSPLSPESRTRYLEIMRRNTINLAALIDDILDLSKVEAGHLEVELIEPCVWRRAVPITCPNPSSLRNCFML